MKIANPKTTLAGIVAALLALFTAIQAEMDDSPDTKADVGQVIATIVTAVGLIGARDSKPAAATDNDDTDIDPPQTGIHMPPSVRSVLMLAMLPAVLLMSAGCASTPSNPVDRLATADKAFITAASILETLIAADVIKDVDTLRAIDTTQRAVNDALGRAHALQQTGEQADFVYYLDEAERLIRVLQSFGRTKESSWAPQRFSPSPPAWAAHSNKSWSFGPSAIPALS